MKYPNKKKTAPPTEITARQIKISQGIFIYLNRKNGQLDQLQLIEDSIQEAKITDSKTINNLHFHVWKLQNELFKFQLVLENIDSFPAEFTPVFYWWLHLRFNWSKKFKDVSSLYDELPSKPASWKDIKSFFRKLETAYENYLNFLKKQDILKRESWQKSCQPWLVSLAKQHFNRGEREAIFLPDSSGTIMLRTNTLKTNNESLLKTLKADGLHTAASRRSPDCILVAPTHTILNLESSKTGLFEIQDKISQLMLELCQIQPGWQAWDVWADDGANSLALATLMKNQGQIQVTNLEKNFSKSLPERAKLAGIDILQIEAPRKQEKFNFVWLAAPNSRTGMIRSNPAIKAQFSEKTFNHLIEKQKELLEKSASGVKPGGILAYQTQSVFPQENDQLIEWFLKKHPEFEPVKISSSLLENYPKKCWTAYGFSTFPLLRKVNVSYLSVLKLKE